MSGVRRAAPALSFVFVFLLSSACVSRKKEPLGGDWYIVWERSNLPEAGGTHPHLYRKRGFGGRRVEENTWRYRYLGDDCVLYVAGNANRGELMAACGNHAPVVIAPHMNDHVQGYIRDTGISGDPIAVSGRMVSVREIKSRAQQAL